MEIPYRRELSFEYGRLEPVAPQIRRLIARNPGPFTFKGTGTYVVGHGDVAVIDPGPLDQAHIDALLQALAHETVTHILVTHTHLDHSPAAAPLKQATGAPTYGYGPHGGARQDATGEAGADWDFLPDHVLHDGDSVSGSDWTLQAVHTPGHTSNHLCFAFPQQQTLFSGDHVMAWSTTVISPPDGNMGHYVQSLRKLQQRNEQRYWPTHGPAIEHPQPHLAAFIHHRLEREQAIIDALTAQAGNAGLTPLQLVALVYRNLDPRLVSAAARSVQAHLLHLLQQGRVLPVVAAEVAGSNAAESNAQAYRLSSQDASP